MLLARVQAVHWESLVILCEAAFQLVSAQCVLVCGIIPSQGQSLAFPFFKLHEIPVSPFLQSDEVPLYVSPSYVSAIPSNFVSSAIVLRVTLPYC